MSNADNMDVLRDLLMEMGIKGAEHLTPFALACLADLMRWQGDVTLETGGWPRRGPNNPIKETRSRDGWAFSRFQYAIAHKGAAPDLNALHESALAEDALRYLTRKT